MNTTNRTNVPVDRVSASKRPSKPSRNLLPIVFGTAVLVIVGGIVGGVFWVRANHREFETKVAAEIEQRTNEEANLEVIAKRERLGWPLRAPIKTKAEVAEIVDVYVKKRAAKEFSARSNLATIVKAAEQKYGLHKPGDHVSFRLRGGTGMAVLVEGRFRGVSEDKGTILIGDRRIRRSDMEHVDQVRFYPELSARYVKEYVQNTTVELRRERIAYSEALRRNTIPIGMRKAGYVQHPETGEWCTRQEAAEAHVKTTSGRIEREVYSRNGYLFRDGVWRPPWLLERVRHMLASSERTDPDYDPDAVSEPEPDLEPEQKPDAAPENPDDEWDDSEWDENALE